MRARIPSDRDIPAVDRMKALLDSTRFACTSTGLDIPGHIFKMYPKKLVDLVAEHKGWTLGTWFLFFFYSFHHTKRRRNVKRRMNTNTDACRSHALQVDQSRPQERLRRGKRRREHDGRIRVLLGLRASRRGQGALQAIADGHVRDVRHEGGQAARVRGVRGSAVLLARVSEEGLEGRSS